MIAILNKIDSWLINLKQIKRDKIKARTIQIEAKKERRTNNQMQVKTH